MKRSHIFTLFSLLAVVPGCSDSESPEFLFRDYLYRLGNVTLAEEVPEPDEVSIPPYPRARDLVLATEQLRIGFGDYFDLAECDLMHLVSERNSSLGLFQRPSGRLLYEMTFFDKVRRCEESLVEPADEEGAEVRNLLATVRRAKVRALPVAYWNATFASEEFRVLLSTGVDPMPRRVDPPMAEVETALSYLAWLGGRLEKGVPDIEYATFENYYARLQRGKLAGQLLRALDLAERYLSVGTGILRRAEAANRICPMGRKTRQGEFLHNVFIKYYAGGVQPYLSRIHGAAGSLLAALDKLSAAQQVEMPPAFVRFHAALLDMDAPSGLWVRFNASLRAHTKAWQGVLRQCDLMPRAPPGP